MKTIFVAIELVLSLYSVLFALYLACLTFAAKFRKPLRQRPRPDFLRRFAILIPAHNEEQVIGQTLSSMEQIDYRNDRFNVFVIADNCTDSTSKLARVSGAEVLERFDEVNKGKGQALRWCLDVLSARDEEYDAFVIVDADTVVSEDILEILNYYLEDGAECIQCSDLVAPQPGNWSPEITRVGFILHNFVRPQGKMALRLSTGLNGNGMCFTRSLMSKIPWSSFSRVEDLEHSLQLVMRGVKVTFAPETTVHATMPADPAIAETQRRRWEVARFPVIRKFTIPLLIAAIRDRSIAAFDMLLELLAPPFVNLFAFTSLMFFADAVLLAFGKASVRLPWILFALSLLLEVYHVLGGLDVAGADHDAYVALLNAPRYAFWKIRLYLKTILTGDDKTWLRTRRENHFAARH